MTGTEGIVFMLISKKIVSTLPTQVILIHGNRHEPFHEHILNEQFMVCASRVCKAVAVVTPLILLVSAGLFFLLNEVNR